jgi:hypothetical protein
MGGTSTVFCSCYEAKGFLPDRTKTLRSFDSIYTDGARAGRAQLKAEKRRLVHRQTLAQFIPARLIVLRTQVLRTNRRMYTQISESTHLI